MLYREVKKNNDQLSILGFGCMRLPQKKGSPGDGKIDEKPATDQIRMAIDQGVNYLDTALPYHMGGCEAFLGKALSQGYREKVKLATKLPHWSVDIPDDMDSILNAQLGRLKTQQIDYYLLHALDGRAWDKMEAMGVADFFSQAKSQGRIINAGFSFHGAEAEFIRIVDAYDWDFCQIQYNYLDRKNQAGTKGLKYAASKDLGVIIMEPLRGGLLGRKPPPAVSAVWQEANIQRTPAEWAFRWIWNHPEVTVVLSGMNDEHHIQENINIAEEGVPESLSKEELTIVQRVEKTYRTLMKAGCTGCGYCMPCPHGVDIPTCFECLNNLNLFGDAKGAAYFYMARVSGLARSPGLASQCQDCGECEEKCPQKLPVRELLKEVSNEFEGPFFNTKIWFFKKFMKIYKWQMLHMQKHEK